MNVPQKGDYIDFHVHGGKPSEGVFILESLMAHEGIMPVRVPGIAYTYGIHPWFLTEANSAVHMEDVRRMINDPLIVAVGEAGLDKLRGPSKELQVRIFEEQIDIAAGTGKPLIIHCVRAWDDLLAIHKKKKPKMPWMIHGFRGSIELGQQLILKGIYLSFWFEFALRPESAPLLRSIPSDRIFLETDGADVDIKDIYRKVSGDMEITVEKLKDMILGNYYRFFKMGEE